jgi:thiol-disulfide isomerase/thioredoxin
MKKILVALIFAGLIPFVFAEETATFANLKNADQIFGKKITAEDLKGKVVFLEYWGINCPPCRDSFPHLVDLQKQYAKTGKFTVLASHVQSDPDAAKKFCEDNKVNFPVFQQFREDAAPSGGGIPFAVIIDHTGKVVAKGHPMEIKEQVRDFVKKAPENIPILGGVAVKLWKTHAQNLSSGKPIAPILNQLKQGAQKDDEKGQEAKSMVEAIEKYLEATDTKFVKMAETQPAETLLDLQDHVKLIAGMESEQKFKDLLTKLKTDPSAVKLGILLAELRKVQEKIEKKPSKALTRQLEEIKKKVAAFEKCESKLVAEEAKAIIERF